PITWTVNGGGTINAQNGNFVALAVPGGPFSVTATASGISTSVPFSVATNPPPTVVHAAAANPPIVSETTTTLTVLGADDQPESGLTYTWTVIEGSATNVSF